MIQEITEQIKKNRMTQYWSLVKSTGVSSEMRKLVDQKMDTAIEIINKTQDIEEKITTIEIFKNAINLSVGLGQNKIDDDVTLTLQYLSMLEDFYQSLFWLEKIENSRVTPEIYWPVLYRCVDRLEGVLYRIKNIQNLISISNWDEMNDILFLIESILKEVLQVELEKKEEKLDFHNEQVAIRRAVLSGVQLIEWIRHQNIEDEKRQQRTVALSQLKAKIEQRKIQPLQESQQNIDFEDYFYQQMDTLRPTGWKLYHQ